MNYICSAQGEGESQPTLDDITTVYTFEKMTYANCPILNLYLIVSRHGSGTGHCGLKNKLDNSIKVPSKDTS